MQHAEFVSTKLSSVFLLNRANLSQFFLSVSCEQNHLKTHVKIINVRSHLDAMSQMQTQENSNNLRGIEFIISFTMQIIMFVYGTAR